MKFEIEHDWQASLATPRPRIGESAKTRLLLLLCALWLCLGLVGHHPWKPDEAQTMGIVKHLLEGGSWAVPAIAGVPTLQNPPLYYLSAAGGAWLLSPWLAAHDAARLVTGLWMALTLLMVGMAGREMWGKGEGRQTTFIFLGSIGLFYPAHLLTPEVAALCGYAMAFHGFTLSRRRPWRAAPLIGGGIAIASLSTGLAATEILLLTALALPLLFGNWRRKSYLTSLATGIAIALPWLVAWMFAAWREAPDLFAIWLASGRHALDDSNLSYFAQILLTWFGWPALPLAAWSLWHFRRNLSQRPQFQLALVFFLVAWLLLGLGADNRDILALPLLLPLSIMGAAAVEQLRRGAASALDWFGIVMFGTLGFLLWLAWFAMMTGFPARLAARTHKLSEAYVPHFDWRIFLAALALTLIWWVVVFKANKRSNRAAVTDWAVGITLVWGLLMTLWLPWLDAAKGYHGMFASMKQALPAQYACVTSHGFNDSQRALLDYYLDIQARPFETVQRVECDLFLVQDEKKHVLGPPGPEWKLIWRGKRPSDRRERYWLYQYSPAQG